MTVKNLSTNVHGHDHEADQELYELLKEGQSVTNSPGDDEESTVGTNPDLYPEPEDREENDIDAPWGEHDVSDRAEHADAVHFSDAFLDSFKQSRERMLSRLFDSKDPSDVSEQKGMSQYLSHAAKGKFQTSSPQLSSKAKLQPQDKTSSVNETLVNKVRRVAGRH